MSGHGYDGLLDALRAALDEQELDLAAEFISTGGGCYAVAIGPPQGWTTGADPHVLLTSGGPLLPRRSHEIREAALDVNREAGWSDDRPVEDGAFPTWSMNVYDGDEGAEVASLEIIGTTIAPSYDETTAEIVAGMLRQIARLVRSGEEDPAR